MAVPSPTPIEEVQALLPYKTLAQQIQFTNKTPINNTLNHLVALLDMQFLRVYATKEELEAALENILEVALQRMNDVFTPLIEEAQRRLEEFGANFSAHSGTEIVVQSNADFGLYVDEADRAGYVYSDYVSIRYAQADDVWMIADVLDYNRDTGYLQVHTIQHSGVGQFDDWNLRMTVAPDLAHANRTDNPHQVTAEQVGAYNKAMTDYLDLVAIATLRGGVISTYDTLQKLWQWTNNSLAAKLTVDQIVAYPASAKQVARINVGIAPGFADYFVQAPTAAVATGLMGVQSKRILNINSGFQISQERGDDVAHVIAGGSVWPVDGWFFHNNTNAEWDVFRTSGFVSPGGSINMLVLKTTVGDVTIDPGQYCVLKTTIEGRDIQQLYWGTSASHPIIVRFGLRSPLAGPFSVVVNNEDNTRSYIATFNVAPADINADKIYYFTIPGCTDGNWRGDERAGIQLSFFFACHSSLTTMTPNQWLGGQAFAAAGQVQGVGAPNLIYVIADVAVYDGNLMIPGDWPAYQLPEVRAEEARCKRRWQKADFNQHFWFVQGSDWYFSLRWPVAMRAIPTLGTAAFFYYPGYTVFTPTTESVTFQIKGNYPTNNTHLGLGGSIVADARI